MRFNLNNTSTASFFIIGWLTVLSCNFDRTPEITVRDAILLPSPSLIGVASAFMHIDNNGDGSDTLNGCFIKEFHSARGKLHDIVGGKMKMMDEIKIPASRTIVLKKGRKHLMFYGLPGKLGDEVILILNFQKTGSIEVKAKVEK